MFPGYTCIGFGTYFDLHHSLAFQTSFANTDIYKCSFFPQTIRDWNSLTDTLLSAAEGAEDRELSSVAKFTSLVRSRV